MTNNELLRENKILLKALILACDNIDSRNACNDPKAYIEAASNGLFTRHDPNQTVKGLDIERRVSRLLSQIQKDYGKYPQSYRGLGFGFFYVKLGTRGHLYRVHDESGEVTGII